ncbi:proliferating cell nuclear antigen, N-terminal domain-containing protein [Panaeolus papilionaceus]|nr:proliferating cell nuclear antigen, N-terminal domain-containing protein [Panaeolus papilionaceus]
MLEAKLSEAGTLKKLLDAIKELVTDANFECNEEGIVLQAMDNSHVALVSVKLAAPGFRKYRCDRPMPLGVNLTSLTKVMRCAKDDDICTLKAADEADVLNMVFEAKNSDRIAEYDLKLMDIDADTLTIPDTEYEARVTMPAAEFARIVRDLSALGESVRIEVSKEGVRFASDGEAANGSVLLKQTDGNVREGGTITVKNEDEEDGKDGEDDEDDDEGSSRKKVKVKKERNEDVDMDEDDEDADNAFKPDNSDGEEEKDDDEEEADDDDEEMEGNKKRKKKGSSKPSKKAKTDSAKAGSSKGKGKAKKGDGDDSPGVLIEMNSHVSLTFSLKYLVNFSKSTGLSPKVQLMMSNDVPLLVSFDFGQGYIRYYLAPKIGDD